MTVAAPRRKLGRILKIDGPKVRFLSRALVRMPHGSGARAFEGVPPDLELHGARVNESAKKMFLKPIASTETWVKLAREGVARFDKDAALYIRPMYWEEKDGPYRLFAHS